MEIRKATENDYIHLVRATQNKHLGFLTAAHIKDDIVNCRCYVVVENGKAIAMVSLVYDKTYNYNAMKRLCIFRKENRGRGITKYLISYLMANAAPDRIGCTPWEDNIVMRHILEGMGFKLQYIFSEKWCFYLKD